VDGTNPTSGEVGVFSVTSGEAGGRTVGASGWKSAGSGRVDGTNPRSGETVSSSIGLGGAGGFEEFEIVEGFLKVALGGGLHAVEANR
jgi:hypothetical protein